MELKEILEKRRSIRHYTNKSVPRVLIEELIRAASMSPVSCNLQLTQYVVVDDLNILKKLSSEVSYKFKYSPCSIVVLHDSRFSVERNSGIMTAGMAVENLLLKATEIGLGTCVMAGFGFDERIKKILSIPDHMEIVLIISVGYIDGTFQMFDVPKLDLNKRYSFNNYGELPIINDSLSISKQSIDDIINYRSRISPVYLDRFRLNSYNVSYYEEVCNHFVSFCKKNKIKRVLDLISYDGVFLELVSRNDLGKISISASDYLVNNLSFIKKKLGFDGVLVKDNKIDSNEFFDLITFVFQFNFTPDVSSLLRSVGKSLNNEGYLLISVVQEAWYRIFYKYIFKNWLLLKGKNVNIYENNPYYKVGPIEKYTDSRLIGLVSETGLKKIDQINIKKGNGVTIKIYLFKKE